MARNGSGTMSIPNSFSSGATITASGHNQNNTDIASELTNSVAADGQTSMTGPLKAANGTNAAPTVTFASDTDTGLYRSAANAMSGSAGGTQIWEFSSAGIDVKSGTFLLAGVAAFPVPTAQIANDAVTYAKIQNVSATARLLGRTTAGAGDIEEISLGAGLSFVAGVLTPGISAVLVPNYLSGLTLSTAGSSATMSIAAGVANDSTNTVLMSLAAIAKTTSSWAVGTGNGGLDTGAIATSTGYHFYEIYRPDTGVVDVVFSLSASSPTLPTNYTLYRRIGWGKTNGSSQWTKFTQTRDTFIWDTAVLDANNAALGSGSRSLVTLTVPTGVVVKALYRANLSSVTSSVAEIFTSPQESDQAASSSNSDLSAAVSGLASGSFATLTNTSAQIGQRGNGLNAVLAISTYGWIDTLGK